MVGAGDCVEDTDTAEGTAMNGITDTALTRVLVIITILSLLFAAYSFINSRLSADEAKKLYVSREEMSSMRLMIDVQFQDVQRSLLQIREGQARIESYIMKNQLSRR